MYVLSPLSPHRLDYTAVFCLLSPYKREAVRREEVYSLSVRHDSEGNYNSVCAAMTSVFCNEMGKP